MDERLGPIERGKNCLTCHLTYKECPGHFGHLVLAKPVIPQVQFQQMIIKLLGFYCNRCSAFLIDKYAQKTAENPSPVIEEVLSKSEKSRFMLVDKILNSSKDKKCPNCGASQPKYTRDREGIIQILARMPDKETDKYVVNPEMIYMIFKNVTDEDVELAGLNPKLTRPEWMLWTIMPVPPPAMRPSVRQDNGRIAEDDLTHKLNEIIKANNILRDKISGSADEARNIKDVDGSWKLLQYHIATYVDNEISNLPRAQQRSGRPLRTLRQRIKAKEGRVRGNLMGKRVNGSGRSVITADPFLSMDQLGIPKRIAMNLTYPELVTPYNIGVMTQLVRNARCSARCQTSPTERADNGDSFEIHAGREKDADQ